jgi:hypothetical protein
MQRKTLNMSTPNDLGKVYIVDKPDHDDSRESSGNDTEYDKRRDQSISFDAISDPTDLQNTMDPNSAEARLDDLPDVNQNPIPDLIPDREDVSTAGAVLNNNRDQQLIRALSGQQKKMQKPIPPIRLISSQPSALLFWRHYLLLALTKLNSRVHSNRCILQKYRNNLQHLPKSPQKVIEYKE